MGWTQNGNIRGASGVPGASGPPGATGPAGPTGASGSTGGTGGTGGPGTTTWAGITDKPGAILNYKGTWNASTNTSPTLSDSTGSGGDVYRVSVAGSRNLGSGTISWEIGDYAIYSPVTSSWEKADTTDAVSSVAGRTGAVTLTTADLGITGTPSASTFLRGDGTWATGPTGATGATGASGGTGGTGGVGASGPGFYRVISTITAPTNVGASGNTDYVYLLSAVSGTETNVTLLLHADGSNGSTTFTDSSSTPKTLTATSATISTTQSKFGGSSIYFNGSSRLTGTNANFAYGSSDWTAECWFYPTSLSGDYMIIMGTRANSGDDATAWSLGVTSAGNLFIYSNTFHAAQTSATITTNSWFHIAAARQGSTVRLYVNGSQVASGTMSNTLSKNTLAIGANNDGSQSITGYVDEVRLTTSQARYTSGFTAPTAAFSNPTSGTSGTPTLPTAASNNGRYAFRNVSGSSIVIGASGLQQINGATGGYSLANGSAVELISDGSSGWYAI